MVLDKKSLRKNIIKMRSDLEDITYHHLSHFIMEKVKKTDDFQSAQTIGIYLSYNHEVDTWDFIKEIMNLKIICVPVVDKDNQMHFVQIDSLMNLKKNRYGIYEPIEGHIIEKNDIDLIVVPVVGYNDDGYRLGYGGGYYDRYLRNYQGKTIGIAFQIQRLDHYIPESHDVALNKIITE